MRHPDNRLMAAVLLLVIVYFLAGYRIGLVQGKGWRDAVIRGDCHMTCKIPPP